MSQLDFRNENLSVWGLNSERVLALLSPEQGCSKTWSGGSAALESNPARDEQEGRQRLDAHIQDVQGTGRGGALRLLGGDGATRQRAVLETVPEGEACNL